MYIADLHIHSRYSRATSRDCTPEHLDLWARKKGISILGTGDFTHPAWRKELQEKLVPAEPGLYTLKEEFRMDAEGVCDAIPPRFAVTGEISSIYKKGGKVRKVHSLIVLPGLHEAELLSQKLETIGNIHSDGRPILGLDCHDLLEITLEISPRAIFIPAHIWTPHFSLFGAFSGFDCIEECFEDLTPCIHALETGLSSDPPMNWRLSALDRFQLVSNSDAHSPAKLGREANLLDTELSYDGLYGAIQKGKGLLGTIEFFPEEGKYHYDGHRKCHLCLNPLEAEKYSGICPVCGRKLTVGVSHRIEQLADRKEGFIPPGAKAFESLVPLPEVIAASTGHSAASIKVKNQYEEMIHGLGAEFRILREIPIEEIRHKAGYMISEGILRLREGRVGRIPGYDGEYGTIQLFDKSEMDHIEGQLSLFSGVQLDEAAATGVVKHPYPERRGPVKGAFPDTEKESVEDGKEEDTPAFNEEQKDAVTALSRAIAVIAGPGTGKTKTLIAHALYLLTERKVKASEMAAVTFTRKAAGEMRKRLEQTAGGRRVVNRMKIGTFHSIAYDLLRSLGIRFTLADEAELLDYAEYALQKHNLKMKPETFLGKVALWKTGVLAAEEDKNKTEDLLKAFETYGLRLREENRLDYDDLLLETLRIIKEEKEQEIRKQSFSYLMVDEFQDISPLQYELVKAWNRNGRELFVIGDPDQAIYSFRGSDARCFDWLLGDYKELQTIRLEKNYRSAPQIVEGALAVIEKNHRSGRKLIPMKKTGHPIRMITASSEMAEGIFAAKEINRLIGGIDMLDTEGMPLLPENRTVAFGDIAILARTHHQLTLYEKCLAKEGIPYVVVGKEDFLREQAVRGTICFFRYLQYQEDMAARRLFLKLLWNLPDEGDLSPDVASIVDKYLTKRKGRKPVKVLESWVEDMKMGESEAMKKLLGVSLFYHDMRGFLDALTFGSEGDFKRCGGKSYSSDSVTLTTVHGAKGLEFPIVMMGGLRQGRFPLEGWGRSEEPEEERRLFYVGMTRAKEELILMASKEPSSFLSDIPQKLAVQENVEKKKSGGQMEQMSLFDFMQEDPIP